MDRAIFAVGIRVSHNSINICHRTLWLCERLRLFHGPVHVVPAPKFLVIHNFAPGVLLTYTVTNIVQTINSAATTQNFSTRTGCHPIVKLRLLNSAVLPVHVRLAR